MENRIKFYLCKYQDGTYTKDDFYKRALLASMVQSGSSIELFYSLFGQLEFTSLFSEYKDMDKNPEFLAYNQRRINSR